MNTRTSLLALAALAAFARPARAQETPPAVEPVLAGNPVPAAIFAFSERGAEVRNRMRAAHPHLHRDSDSPAACWCDSVAGAYERHVRLRALPGACPVNCRG